MFEVTLNSEFDGVLKRELFENESEAYNLYYELEAEADKLTEMSLLNDQEDYHFAELIGDYKSRKEFRHSYKLDTIVVEEIRNLTSKRESIYESINGNVNDYGGYHTHE